MFASTRHTGQSESYYHGEGRVALTGDKPAFQYKMTDHLGNTMVLFEDRDDDKIITTESMSTDPALVEVLQRNFYYAFGLPMQGPWNHAPADPHMPYLYNGKELEGELGLGWYAYGFRYYDASVGRFVGVDPLASDFVVWSSFSYTFNNPIRFIDPDGRAPQDIIILGSKAFQNEVKSRLFDLANSSAKGLELVRSALSSNHHFIIQEGSGGNEVYFGGRDAGGNALVYFDVNLSSFEAANCEIGGDFTTGLGHEMQHFMDISQDGYRGSHEIPYGNYLDDYGDVETVSFRSTEISAVNTENHIRAVLGYNLRQEYEGIKVFGMKVSLTSASYFEGNGLKSQSKYWNLVPDPGFRFSPDFTRPTYSEISDLWRSIRTTNVNTKEYKNQNTFDSSNAVPVMGIKLSIN